MGENGAYGKCNLFKFSVDLNGQTKPVKCKQRKLNPEQQHSLQTKVDDWVKTGVVEQVEQVSDEG